MKQQVFYIHGGESFANQVDFLDRLKTKGIWDLPSTQKLGKWNEHLPSDLGDNFEVFLPQMPNRQNARYEEWKLWFERYFEYLQDGVILVGCSLGGMFLLRYCSEETLPFSIKALFLMATPLPLPDLDARDCGDFLCSLDQVPKLVEKIATVVILHSKDDFLVPYTHAIELQALLPTANLITFEDKNHFLVPELPELVTLIKSMS
ncbi:MAG: hypothetical protein AUK16_01330 [Parcubacteria group bacterium CG2_30_44_11]|nr:MAG: hypothetical protein AUK16_01330 [Parcubacteria group bacterium CG2_30_44_11]